VQYAIDAQRSSNIFESKEILTAKPKITKEVMKKLNDTASASAQRGRKGPKADPLRDSLIETRHLIGDQTEFTKSLN